MQNINTKKLSSLLFIISLLYSTPFFAVNQEETIFGKISNYYINSFSKPSFTQDELNLLSQSKPDQYKEVFKKILKNKKEALRYTKIVLDLLEQNQLSKSNDEAKKTCYPNDTLWKDLELFCGDHTPSCHLLSKINRTQTTIGTIMLAKMMVEPTANIAELQKKQAIIKTLIENEEAFTKLNETIKKFAAIETELLSFWYEKNFNTLFSPDFYYPPYPLDLLPDSVLNTIFPINMRNQWNQSSLKLGTLNLFNNFNAVRRMVNELNSVSMYIKNVSDYASEIYNTYYDIEESEDSDEKNPIKKAFFYVKKYTFGLLQKYTLKQLDEMCPPQLTKAIKILWQGEQIGWNAAQIPITILDVSKAVRTEIAKLKILKTAFLRLQKAALTVNGICEIKKIIDSNNALATNIDFLENIKFVFYGSESKSKEFDNLLALLKTDFFKDSHNPNSIELLFNEGKILASSFVMARTQDNLVDILQAIGQIDAYLSLTKLVKEAKSQNATYSFANYVKQETPYINIKDFWTPFISPEKVVLNNIELGKAGQAKDIVISGPNAGGKSTILKSLMINVLFAQTLGIVPAKELTLTPMIYLDTYLNITDDIASGNSLFKSEVLRVKTLLETIKALQEAGFSFVIMDEIFSGTNPIEGEAAGYAIGKYIAKLPNTIALIASHFPKITNLETDTKGVFKNYKVTVNKLDNKILSYPFKLEEGKTDQTIAISILEAENFDPEIISNAYGIIKN